MLFATAARVKKARRIYGNRLANWLGEQPYLNYRRNGESCRAELMEDGVVYYLRVDFTGMEWLPLSADEVREYVQ